MLLCEARAEGPSEGAALPAAIHGLESLIAVVDVGIVPWGRHK